MKNKEEFIKMIKELVKEKVEKSRVLLESPSSNRLDKVLTEKLSRLFDKKSK